MSLNACRTRLGTITKELTVKWEQTREHWHDAKSLEFEKKYMEELEASVETAVAVIDQLDKLMNRIRCDCE